MTEFGKLALLWRGDREARRQATTDNNRWHEIFSALKSVGIHAEPAVYCEEAAQEVRDQLLKVDGVLVWVDPISDGRNRLRLDAMLRDVAARGIWISTHPDVTQKMGVKQVLHTTKHLGWGTDTQLYRTVEAFREQFPWRLRTAGPESHQAEPWQWRPRRVEGRALLRAALCRYQRPAVTASSALVDLMTSWAAVRDILLTVAALLINRSRSGFPMG